MPTEEQISVAINDLSEKVGELGYYTRDTLGPIESDLDHPNKELEDEKQNIYYLTFEGEDIGAYIAFSDQYKFALIRYPYSIASYLSNQLNFDEISDIIGENPKWDDIDDELEEEYQKQAGIAIIENTPIEELLAGKFYLYIYSSTSIVSYKENLAENNFPHRFECYKAIFPYTEHVSIADLDEKLVPVLIAGERGRKYVESAFVIEKDGEPKDYKLRIQF